MPTAHPPSRRADARPPYPNSRPSSLAACAFAARLSRRLPASSPAIRCPPGSAACAAHCLRACTAHRSRRACAARCPPPPALFRRPPQRRAVRLPPAPPTAHRPLRLQWPCDSARWKFCCHPSPIMMATGDSRTSRIRTVYGRTVRLGTVSHRTVAVPYFGCQMAVRYGYGSTVP